MERKGQVTIFMIIGIVLILALIIVFVYLGISGKMDIGAFQQKTTKLPSEMRGIQTFVESCIKRTGEMALLNLGLQGGLYERVDDACFTKRDTCYNTGELGYLIPNYILNNDETQADTYFPTRDEFEDELNKFFNDNFNECIGDFESFKEIGFQIESEGVPVTTVDIQKGRVQIIVDMPTTLKVGGVDAKLEQAVQTIDVDLDHVLNAAQRVYDAHLSDPNSVPLSDLTNLGLEEGFYFELLYADQQDVLYGLMFPNVTMRDSPYVFAFGGAYYWPDLVVEQLPGPEVDFQCPETVTAGNLFTCTIATGNYECKVLSGAGFLEEKDCTISFAATESLAQGDGRYPVIIQVLGEDGGVTTVTLTIKVLSAYSSIAPVFEPGSLDLTATPYASGQELNIQLAATTPGGSPVMYTFDGNYALDLDAMSGLVTGTAPTAGGVYSYKVIAINLDHPEEHTEGTLTIKVE